MPPAHRLQEKVGAGAWTTVPSTIGTSSKAYSGKAANTYYYKIDSWDGESHTWSTDEGPVSVLVTAPNTPNTPTPLSSPDINGAYDVDWGNVTGSTYYEIEERPGTTGTWINRVSVTPSVKSYSGKADGTWQHHVRACNTVGCSGWSGIFQITVVKQPGVVAAPTVTPDPSVNGSLAVYWSSATGSVTEYRLKRSVNGAAYSQVYAGPQKTSSNPFTESGLNSGAYAYIVTACNINGSYEVCSASWSVESDAVVSYPPTANDDSLGDGNPAGDVLLEDEDVTFNVVSNDADPENNPLTITGVTNPSHGTLAYNPSGGTITYTPAEDYAGSDSFSYTIRDTADSQDTATVSLTVTAVNDPPEAFDDARNTDQDTAIQIAVLDNDEDTENSTLSVSAVGSAGHGNVSHNGTTVTYTPAPGFSGPDSFSYTVMDGAGATDVGTVDMAVLSAAGEAGDVSDLTAPAGSADGNIPLSWTAAPGNVSYHEVERTFDGQTTLVNTGSASTTTTLVESVNASYELRVRACDSSAKCGAFSNPVTTVVSISDTLAETPALTGGDAGPGLALGDPFNGIVPGSHGVTGSGAATYTIPLLLPPGTAGTQPALALAYNSQAGNGLLGHGWSLSGVGSQISRCPQTPAQNGNIHAVDYTGSDRFCLDGQQLIVASGDTYGADGSEYRTEVDGFDRITSYGVSTGGDPEWFEVETRAGLILRYGDWNGGSTDARIEAQGKSQAVKWLLKQVEDRYGNYYKIGYTEDTANGEASPDFIQYTGNAEVSPALAPYVQVDLEYETRTDVIPRYHHGSAARQSKRIKNIKTYVDADSDGNFESGEWVRDYVLAYTEAGHAGAPRLETVTLCAPSGCALPTNVDWTEERSGYDPAPWQAWQGQAPATGALQKWVDLNGDGRLDYVTTNGATHYVSLGKADGSGYEAVQTWTAHALGTSGSEFFVDLNGDGKTDYLTMDQGSDPNHYWSLSTDSGYSAYQIYTTGIAVQSTSLQFMTDMNGDGLPDFVRVLANGITRVALNNGGGYETQSQWVDGPDISSATYNFHDVNGDHRSDLIIVDGTTHTIYLSDGTGFASPQTWAAHANGSESGRWADLNGDGRSDYITIDPVDTTKHYISLSTGTGYNNLTGYWTAHAIGASGVAEFRDMNGDGLSDFVTMDNNGNHKISFSNGRDGYVNETWSNGIAFGTSNVYDFVDLNGDGQLDFVSVDTNGDQNVALNRTTPAQLMTRVTDGLGVETTFEYRPLTDPAVYTQGSGATFSVLDITNATQVVARMTHSDAIGGVLEAEYEYEGFRYDRTGRGSLGFARSIVRDIDRDTTAASDYSQTWPTVGMATHAEVRQTSSHRLLAESDTVYTQANSAGSFGTTFVYAQSQTRKLYDPEDGRLLSTTTTTNSTPDGYGNSDVVTVTAVDEENGDTEYQTVTTRQFTNDVTSWFLGQVDEVHIRNEIDSSWDSGKDRTTAFTYNSFGQVATRVIEPDETAVNVKRTTTFTYHPDFGTLIEEELSSPDTEVATRSETVDYDSRGRFPVLLTNAAGHEVALEYDAAYGLVTEITDVNGLVTTRTYDDFGRLIGEDRPDGTQTSVGYRFDDSGGNLTARIYAETTVTGGTPLRTFYDRQGREVRRRVKSFDGASFVHLDTEYDDRGRVKRTSQPYYAGESVHWNEPAYDAFNRVIGLAAADATQSTSTDYDGFTVTVTDALGRASTQVRNAVGQVTEVEDALGNRMTYAYDTAGNLTAITKAVEDLDGLENTVFHLYDRLGRRIETEDPDAGLIAYRYDALGQLREQTTPTLRDELQTQTLSYDLLGRPVERVEPDFAGSTAILTTVWTYDATAGGNLGIGQLTKEELFHSAETGARFSRSYHYADTVAYAAGKLTGTTTVIEDNGTQTYTTALEYDSAGRLSTLTYPASPSYAPGAFAIQYVYNPRGYLERVAEAASPATVFYQATAVDAEGRLTGQWLGDGSLTARGYQPGSGRLISTNAAIEDTSPVQVQNLVYHYDGVGNLSSRSDLLQGLTETFSYDALNRLTQAEVDDGSTVTTTLYSYNTLGNLTTKSDIPNLNLGGMEYGDSLNPGVLPHALTNLSTTGGDLPFEYDANGNQTAGDAAGGSRTVTWTSYDLPASITRDGVSRAFLYGPDRQRYRQEHSDGTVTHYVAGLYERVVNGSSETHRLFIQANGETIAIHEDDADTGSSSVRTRYLHRDHLGSISAISEMDGGINIERLSYDAFGRRRNAETWVGDPISTPTEVRGYTGHEHLDDVGLIHMNGRIYDPLFGRMLSPDPLVPSPGDAQRWNPYSYVSNRPLNYTDPSGLLEEVHLDAPPWPAWYVCLLGMNGYLIVPVVGTATGFDGGTYDILGDPATETTPYDGTTRHGIKYPPAPEILPEPIPAAPADLSPNIACGQGGNDCYAPAAAPAPTPNPVNPVRESGGSPTTVAETLRDFANYTINERGGIGGELFDILGGGDILEGTADVLEGNLGGAAWNVATTIFKPAKIVEKAEKIVPFRLPDGYGSLDDLSRNAGRAGRNGSESAATRAIQSHHDSPRGPVTSWPKVTGNPATKNAATQDMVDEILTNPDSTFTQHTTGRFGEVLDVVGPDGKGLRFGKGGQFIGVLEPPR
jgi:RHS repeat-associated protein